MLKVDFSLVERDVKLRLELVGNRAGGNGTEHFSVVAGLDDDDRDQFGNALGQVAHGVELMRLALGTALAQNFQAALVGAGQRHGKTLGKQIIARVTGGDFDLVGFGAQADDVVSENDFRFHAKG